MSEQPNEQPARAWPEPSWWAALPLKLGAFRRNVPLAELTTIGVGGPAEVLVALDNWEAMSALLRHWQATPVLQEVPMTLLGAGSNMIVRDGGLPGLVVQIGAGCDLVRVNTEARTLYAEAGASCGKAARFAREAGLGGLAFFGGIPGNIGGALRMNAGAYGGETYTTLHKLWLIDEKGEVVETDADFVQPRYRHTALPKGWLFKAGEWRLPAGDKEQIRQRMRDINHTRSATQPLSLPSSGSWFKNLNCQASEWPAVAEKMHLPAVFAHTAEADQIGLQLPSPQPGIRLLEGGGVQLSAWRVLDAAGCRGLRVGGAQASEIHPNFFVNIGLTEQHSATAADFAELASKAQARVKARLNLDLEEEVKWLGVA